MCFNTKPIKGERDEREIKVDTDKCISVKLNFLTY